MRASPKSSGHANRLPVVPSSDRLDGGKVIGRTNVGRSRPVGIAQSDARQHVHVLGPTGTGKSSLLLNMVLGDVEAGHGVAVFDPKGDLINDLLARLPKSCGPRLVLIDPDDPDACPAMNLLGPADAAGPHETAAHLTSVMARVWSRWWGHRTADIAHHALLTLAATPNATLAQLPRLLADTSWRTRTLDAAAGRLDPWQSATLRDFWTGIGTLPPGTRAALVAPLLAKLRLVLAHPLAAGLFGIPSTTFSFTDILDGAVLLVRLPKGIVGDDGCRFIGSLLLAGLWRASIARARIREDHRQDCSIYVDECHNFLHLPIGIDDALAEARGMRTSFVLAHQYLGQLSSEMAESIDANARNKVFFTLAPDDALKQARHLRPYLDDGDLTRLGGYEAVLRPVAKGRPIPPCTVDTYPPPPVIRGRARQLRKAARMASGLPSTVRKRLLADTTATPPTPLDQLPVPIVPIGVNHFTEQEGQLEQELTQEFTWDLPET